MFSPDNGHKVVFGFKTTMQMCENMQPNLSTGQTYSGITELIPAESWHAEMFTWNMDKMAALSQITISNAFSWMEIFVFRFRFVSQGSN